MNPIVCSHNRTSLQAVQNAVQQQIGRWYKDELIGCILDVHQNFNRETYTKSAIAALSPWTDPLGIKLRFLTPGVDSGKRYDIGIRLDRIDGPGGVLANMQLPPGDNRPLIMNVDAGDNFSLEQDGNGYVDLAGPMCHEFGHAMGLDHDDSKDALMYFQWLGKFKTPQPRDIARLKALYPEMRPNPTPTDGLDYEALYRQAVLDLGKYKNMKTRISSILDELQ